jgi:hypothetical protein
MARFMRVDPHPHPETGEMIGMNYRLPADADLEKLAEDLAMGMRSQASIVVKVEMGDDPLNTALVILNGNTVSSVLLAETPEPDD